VHPPRSAGLLLHVTSLPGGTLGPEAYRFVDFLCAAGQRWWQMLPVGPPGHGGSPYAALSAFAGNEALLPPDATPDAAAKGGAGARGWRIDYARFAVLKERHGGAPWWAWPPRFRDRDPRALRALTAARDIAVRTSLSRQAAFDRAWSALKRYANDRGVGLVGDLPLFVAHDSADVWAHRERFKLDARGRTTVVTGVPPDYFSEDGQRWGNPHYRWDVMRRRRFRWWRARLDRLFELFDVVRVDHFLGLLRAWEIPARAKTARRGRFVPGPGASFVRSVLAGRPVLAEDLGLVTPEAAALRDRFGIPGMRVLQFSFGPNPEDRPFSYPRRSVVYTGTHDNDTVAGWASKGGPDVKRACAFADCAVRDLPRALVRTACLAPSDLAVVPVQDVLGLGSRARMNTPGTTRGNWRWRLRRGQLTDRHARWLRGLAEVAGR